MERTNRGRQRVKLDNVLRHTLWRLAEHLWDIRKTVHDRTYVRSVDFTLANGRRGTVKILLEPHMELFGEVDTPPGTAHNPHTFYMLVNPKTFLNVRNVYSLLFHEFMHLTDPTQSVAWNDRYCKETYSADADETYYGHDIEFRAFVNEFLEGLVNAFADGVSRGTDGATLWRMNREILDHFNEGGALSSDTIDLLQGVGGFDGENRFKREWRKFSYRFPFLKKLYWAGDAAAFLTYLYRIREFNPRRWPRFLTLLYAAHGEIETVIETPCDSGTKVQYRFL